MHHKLSKPNILADALPGRPEYDPRSALSRQEVDDNKYDDDVDDDRCVMCLLLN